MLYYLAFTWHEALSYLAYTWYIPSHPSLTLLTVYIKYLISNMRCCITMLTPDMKCRPTLPTPDMQHCIVLPCFHLLWGAVLTLNMRRTINLSTYYLQILHLNYWFKMLTKKSIYDTNTNTRPDPKLKNPTRQPLTIIWFHSMPLSLIHLMSKLAYMRWPHIGQFTATVMHFCNRRRRTVI